MFYQFFIILYVSYIINALSLEEPNEGKIVGGSPARIQAHPHQISLQRPGWYHTCGGSIIAPNLILTAAHCIYNKNVQTYQIRAGSAMRYSGGVTIPIKNGQIHPEYNPDNNDNDVAILELTGNLKFSTTIQAIKLPPKNFVVPDNMNLVVSGWGTMKAGAATSPNGLRAAIVPYVNQTYCSSKYFITPRMICAGKFNKDSCQGDSGLI